jgi:hypothetical protein
MEYWNQLKADIAAFAAQSRTTPSRDDFKIRAKTVMTGVQKSYPPLSPI